jgi:hypothetical protein
MGMHYEDYDLEPFLSEVRDDALPPRWRLGSLLYLEARETFLSPEHRDVLDAPTSGYSPASTAIRQKTQLHFVIWRELFRVIR